MGQRQLAMVGIVRGLFQSLGPIGRSFFAVALHQLTVVFDLFRLVQFGQFALEEVPVLFGDQAAR